MDSMNEIIKDVKCTKLDHFGRGIARIDNRIVFIHNMLPKESGNIKIIKKNNKYMEGETVELFSKTLDRVIPHCKYYDKCGGCQLLHMNNKLQEHFKYDKVKDILSRFAGYNNLVEPLITGEKFNYRNKVTLHVKNRKIGLYESFSNDLVEINECVLLNDTLNNIIKDLKEYLKKNEYNGTEVILRKVDNRTIVYFDADINIKNIKFSSPVSVFVLDKLVMGEENNYIVLNGLKFKVSPNSFFQVNNEIVSILYDKVIDVVKENKPNKLLDLYCGTGTMGLIASKYAKSVTGVELNQSAIKDANHNKELNNINNISFILGKVEDNMSKFTDIDMMIIDPPRAGIMRKGIDDIIKIGAKTIIYVSCDPVTLARDITLLNDKYEIKKVIPIDMFPNTYHVECVCVMKLR